MENNPQIDLLYLTNPNHRIKYNNINNNQNNPSEEDIKFYRKRILTTTKDYLRGKQINESINNAFQNYATELIKHYKFIDKKEIIQKEYENVKIKTKTITKEELANFKVMEKNELMMKRKEDTKKTIKDFIPIVVKEKKKKKMIIPKQKEFNIKKDEFRKKGIL
tara:strand:+ start:843 stop:1334 length:492 start_codon:yes stop_codon:yes gene_type:complete